MSNICTCKKITEEVIVNAVKEGAKTFEEVKDATKAGSGCCKGRKCKSKINEIIENN